MLTFDEIFGALRSCVMYSSFSPEWGRLNTFSVMDNRAELLESALGKGYDDFLAGYFWARQWVYGGADPHKMEKEWGLLTVEHKSSKLASLEKMETWSPMSIGVFLNREGDDVNGLRPKKQVEEEAIKNVWRVLSRLSKMYKYHLVEAGTGAVSYTWMSPGEAEWLIANGKLDDYDAVNQLGRSMGLLMRPEGNEWDVYLTNFELGENIVSAAVNVEFNTCQGDTGSWDYDIPAIANNKGIIIC